MWPHIKTSSRKSEEEQKEIVKKIEYLKEKLIKEETIQVEFIKAIDEVLFSYDPKRDDIQGIALEQANAKDYKRNNDYITNELSTIAFEKDTI